MSVAFDAVGPAGGGGNANAAVTSTSWTHTCSGVNRVLFVGLSLGGANANTATITVTYNGVAMALVGTTLTGAGTTGRARLFVLVNPATGANTVQVNSSASLDIIGGSISFTGVHQTTPHGTAVTGISTTNSVSVNVPTVESGNMVVDHVACGSAITASTQTQRWLRNLNGATGGGNGAGSTAAGAGGTVAMGYTRSGVEWWGIVAVEVIASTGVTVESSVAHGVALEHAAAVDITTPVEVSAAHGLTLGHAAEVAVAGEGFDVGEGTNVVNVNNCAQLQNAINNAVAGDKIVLADGTYNCDITIAGIFGADDQGLTIEALNWGSTAWNAGLGARITGAATWWINNAENITIRGIWHHGNPTAGSPDAFHFLTGSSYCRLTACHVQMDNSDATGAGDAYENNYVYVEGTNTHHIAIDHNEFRGKRTEGAYLYTQMNDTDTASVQYVWVHHNYFVDFLGNADLNYEPLRIGHCTAKTSESFHLVEYNVLEALAADNEIISSKCSRQTFRYNLIKNCRGALDLRCGNNSSVYGNAFVQDDAVLSPGMGGVTVDEGVGHRIFNNYLQGLLSDAANRPGGIILEVNESAVGDEQIDDAQIYNNTLVNCQRPLQIGRDRGGGFDQQPINCEVINNLVSVNTIRPCITQGTGVTATYDQNILFNAGAGGTGGIDPGPITTDPGLALSSGLYRWTTGSVAEDAALATFKPADDFEGRTRGTPHAIGALEIDGAVTRPLLTTDDVGPDAIVVSPDVFVAVTHGITFDHEAVATITTPVFVVIGSSTWGEFPWGAHDWGEGTASSHGFALGHQLNAVLDVEPEIPPLPSMFPDCCRSTVEFKLGDWVNVTDRVYWRDRVAISGGRQEERGQTDPMTCDLVLNDPDGRFAERNPLGPYYGLLTRNTPMRVVMHGGSPYLNTPNDDVDANLDYITTPDTAALSITGDIDIRIQAYGLWRPDTERGLARKWVTTGNQRSWMISIVGANDTGPKGAIRFRWSPNGSTIFTATSNDVVEHHQFGQLSIRVVLDVNNGAAGNTVTFYVTHKIHDVWEQLGDPVTQTGTTSIFNSTAPIELGRVHPNGVDIEPWQERIQSFELRQGINGAERSVLHFGEQIVGDIGFPDMQDNLWTVQGNAEITQRRPRFYGEIASWPQEWDEAEQAMRVPIQAAGVMRRYGQGALPVQSTLRRGLRNAPNLIGYWPLEDGTSTQRPASAISGAAPMRISGSPKFKSFEGFLSSNPIVTLNDAHLAGYPAKHARPSQVQVRWIMHVPEEGSVSGQTLVQLFTTSLDYEIQYWTGGALRINIRNNNGDVVDTGFFSDFAVHDKLLRVSFTILQEGSKVRWRLATITPEGVHISHSTLMSGRKVSQVEQVVINPGGGHVDVAIGHLTIQTRASTLTDFIDELSAYNGEPAGRRIERLCDENNIDFVAYGDLDDTAFMGPQLVDTVINLIQEAAETDGGMLSEPRDRLGIAYRPRTSFYNQHPSLLIDCCSGELGAPLVPVFDDRFTRNDIEVSRQNGAMARARVTRGKLSIRRPPHGVGQYPDSATVNVVGDELLRNQAGHRLALGTVDEPRYPQITFKPLAPVIAQNGEILSNLLDVEIGSRLLITNPPMRAGIETVDSLILGWTESFTDLKDNHFDLVFACSPGSPWDVGEFSAITEDPVYMQSHYDTEDSRLAAIVDDSQTTIGVDTLRGQRWTTDLDNLPFDVMIGGERMTVTAITSGTIQDPAIGEGNGSTTASTSHVAPTVDPQSIVSRLFGAWASSTLTGNYTVPGTMTAGPETDGHISTMRTATQELGTGALTGTRTATFSVSNAWSALLFAVHGSGSAPAVQEVLDSVVSSTLLEAEDIVFTTAETTERGWWLVAIQALSSDGGDVISSPGNEDEDEDVVWTFIGASTVVSDTVSRIAAWIRPVNENGVQTVTFKATPALADNHARLYVVSGVVVGSQQFTVDRAMNDVAKPHGAATDVRLARPARYSL